MSQQLTIGNRNSERALVERLIAGYLSHTGRALRSQQAERQRQDPQTAEILQALLALTDEYERRFKSQLAELGASWDLSSASPRQSFVEVLNTVFSDDCNWGRVVTVFIFVGMFLRKCSHRVTVDEVADWSADYLMDRLGSWIREHGGWMGLVHFYREGDAAGQLAQDGRLFKRLLTAAAGAGIVLLTLGSLLTNRA